MTECTTVKMEPSPEIKTERDTGSEPLLMSEGEEQPVARAPAALTAPTDGPSGVKEEPGIDIVDDAAGTAAAKDIPAVAADGTTAASSSSDAASLDSKHTLNARSNRSEDSDVCNMAQQQSNVGGQSYSANFHLPEHSIFSEAFLANECPPVATVENSNHDEQGFKCDVCGKSFTAASVLKVHIQINHKGEKIFKCEICDKRFCRKDVLTIHRRTHSSECPFECTICGRGFKFARNLKKHMFSHSDERGFKCDVCGLSYKRSSDLYYHKRKHTYLEQQPYKCDICGAKYAYQSGLSAHKKVHSSERTFNCRCGMEFPTVKSLKEHKYTTCLDRPFKCTMCEKAFITNGELDMHVKTLHETIHHCTSCDQTFARHCNLIRHTLDKHSDERPFGCDLCGRRFVRKSGAQKHRAWHMKKQTEQSPASSQPVLDGGEAGHTVLGLMNGDSGPGEMSSSILPFFAH